MERESSRPRPIRPSSKLEAVPSEIGPRTIEAPKPAPRRYAADSTPARLEPRTSSTAAASDTPFVRNHSDFASLTAEDRGKVFAQSTNNIARLGESLTAARRAGLLRTSHYGLGGLEPAAAHKLAEKLLGTTGVETLLEDVRKKAKQAGANADHRGLVLSRVGLASIDEVTVNSQRLGWELHFLAKWRDLRGHENTLSIGVRLDRHHEEFQRCERSAQRPVSCGRSARPSAASICANAI